MAEQANQSSRAPSVQDPRPGADPSAILPALNGGQLDAVGDIGREWAMTDGKGASVPELPVNPSLGSMGGEAQASRFVRLVPVHAGDGAPHELEAASADAESDVPVTRAARRLARALVGPPLKSSAIVQERMRKLVALPVLSADALSSVAYGPEAMLAVLVLGGGAGLGWSLPISGAIVFLMLAVGLSYRQTIRAYPHGGGSYIVASDNLGQIVGLIAAAGLITDYILTVTVSIASGLEAVTSALPTLSSAIVPLGLGMIVLLMAGNLRGVRQAGALFAAPTYAFILAIVMLVLVGLVDASHREFQAVPTPAVHASEGVGVLLVLRAFSSGSTAMTGIEAISNAVPAFKPVEWRNARTTLSWMVGLLIAMFVGIIALVELDGVVPQPTQTVLSQLARRDFGAGPLYVYIQAATALVLLLAANTAYNDFPRVMFLLARDHLAPVRYLKMGDRLAFSNGIIVLSAAAAIIFVAFNGDVNTLIPLYAVGVFLAFTLSQAGMVVHWWRLRTAGWRTSMAFNAVGCALAAIVFLIAGITKFTEGAWVALAVIVTFTGTALLIRRHYDDVEQAVALGPHEQGCEAEETPAQVSNLAIVPIAALNLASMRALAYAASLGQPTVAVHISPTNDEAERFRNYWTTWGNHIPLEVVQSPYRAIVAPTIAYIESLRSQRPDLTLTVIVPEIVVRHWWQRWLHDHTAARLRRALMPLPKVLVTSVPLHLPR